MSAAATSPAPEESIVDRIARLRRELADAEIDKAGGELGEVAGNFVALVPECWDEDEEQPPTVEELQAALGFCREAWQRFETWRAAARAKAAASAAARPCLALPPVPAPAPLSDHREPCPRAEAMVAQEPALVPSAEEDLPLDLAAMGDDEPSISAPAPTAKRPPGSGAIYRAGMGWRWSIRRSGMAALQGRTFPAEALALADLDRVVAERAAGGAPPDLISLATAVPVGPIVKENTCSICGDVGHNARRHRTDDDAAAERARDPTTPKPASSRWAFISCRRCLELGAKSSADARDRLAALAKSPA